MTNQVAANKLKTITATARQISSQFASGSVTSAQTIASLNFLASLIAQAQKELQS